jgi:hypothetical protein
MQPSGLHQLDNKNRVGPEICLTFLSLVLRIPEAQVAAHGDAGVEGLDAEVYRAVHVAKVRQLDPETVFLNFKGAQNSIQFRQPMKPGGPERKPYSLSVPISLHGLL